MNGHDIDFILSDHDSELPLTSVAFGHADVAAAVNEETEVARAQRVASMRQLLAGAKSQAQALQTAIKNNKAQISQLRDAMADLGKSRDNLRVALALAIGPMSDPPLPNSKRFGALLFVQGRIIVSHAASIYGVSVDSRDCDSVTTEVFKAVTPLANPATVEKLRADGF